MLGQISLEYLSTYSWAIVILVTVIGALGYFGFFEINIVEETTCNTGVFLSCEDIQLDTSRISIKLKNNMEDAIKDVSISGFDRTIRDCILSSQVINEIQRGESAVLTCTCIDPNFFQGDNEEITFKIGFSRAKAGSPNHEITGILRANVNKEVIGTC